MTDFYCAWPLCFTSRNVKSVTLIGIGVCYISSACEYHDPAIVESEIVQALSPYAVLWYRTTRSRLVKSVRFLVKWPICVNFDDDFDASMRHIVCVPKTPPNSTLNISASTCRTAHRFLHILTYITEKPRDKLDMDWEKIVDLRCENVKICVLENNIDRIDKTHIYHAPQRQQNITISR